MPLTRESLQTDLAQFKSAKEQLTANINALSGAIQYLEGKLKALDAEPKAEVVKD